MPNINSIVIVFLVHMIKEIIKFDNFIYNSLLNWYII